MGQILVTGAAGNVGREVVSHLLAKGASVKAAVFSAKQDVLPGGVGRVRFDFADPATTRKRSRALTGCSCSGPRRSQM